MKSQTDAKPANCAECEYLRKHDDKSRCLLYGGAIITDTTENKRR